MRFGVGKRERPDTLMVHRAIDSEPTTSARKRHEHLIGVWLEDDATHRKEGKEMSFNKIEKDCEHHSEQHMDGGFLGEPVVNKHTLAMCMNTD